MLEKFSMRLLYLHEIIKIVDLILYSHPVGSLVRYVSIDNVLLTSSWFLVSKKLKILQFVM